MDLVMKVLVWPIIVGLAAALGGQLGASIALESVTPATPAILVWVYQVLKSGMCYLIFPAIAVLISIAQQRG